MFLLYAIFSVIVLVVVALITKRHERLQGEDYEPDELAITKNVAIGLVALISLWFVVRTIASHLVDYWWFQEVGYANVWITRKTYEWGLRIAVFVGVYVGLTITEFFAHLLVPGIPSLSKDEAPRRREYGKSIEVTHKEWQVYQRYYRWISRFVKLILSLGFAWAAILLLNNTLKLENLVEWGTNDPVFGLDYSFYDVVLPTLRMGTGFVGVFLVVAACFTALVYYFLNVRNEALYGYDNTEAKARFYFALSTHALLFGAGTAVPAGISTYLSRYETLVDGSSKVISGAGYVNVTATIPGLGAMTWLWATIALALVIAALIPRKTRLYTAYISGGVFLVVWLVAMVIMPGVKTLQFNTNPLAFERPYIQYQMAGTRFAFDLDHIQDQGQLGYASRMGRGELEANNVTLNQARVVDWVPMLSANETLNEYLPFYNFVDVDIDRYNGEEVMLAVRELNQDQIPEDARNWVNIHFRYTHGYGYTVASVSQIDTQGEPQWLVRNMPPTGPEEFLVDRPEVYFGEITRSFVFVNGSYTEFGRPEGTSLQEVKYDGPAGIAIGNFWRRLALALIMDDYRLVFTGLIGPDSRIIFNRTLDQRLAKLGWFLKCDEDPYAVLGGEEIVYVRDCYTVSGSLPYSDSYGNARYMRGSVKITVGAWSGETNLYVVDVEDPIIRTWMAVFPNLFKPIDEMPEYLRQHLRYPDDLIRAQADAYALYHVDTPEAFFNRQDLWERAKETQNVGGEASYADPRYVMMVIPGGEEEEFVSNVFFTPINKQNVVAGMIARNDGENYGELLVFQFPRDETVIGFQMLEARINQHTDLAGQINVLNLQGGVLWGQTIGLVLPAKDGALSLAYIRSLYLQSQEARIPSVKLVIIGQGDQLVYASSLEGALELLYEAAGRPTAGTEIPTEISLEELINQARLHFEAVQSCAAQGNWVCFGSEMQALQTALEALGSK